MTATAAATLTAQCPEGDTDLQRAQRYLDGDPVQLQALVENLAGLVRSSGRAAWRIVAAVAHRLPSMDKEGQAAAAAAFAALGREHLLPPPELAELLPVVLAGLSAASGTSGHTMHARQGAHSSPELQAAWLACLAELAPALEPRTLRAKLLPLVVGRGPGAAAALPARCLSCALLGLLAPRLGREELERTGLRAAAALCQDTEWQVRRAMCLQLPTLVAATAGPAPAPLPQPPGTEALMASVLAETLALADDEEAAVRAAAWRSLAAMVPLASPAARRRLLLPAALRQAQLPDRALEVVRAVAAGAGALLGGLLPEADSEPETGALLALFRGLAGREDIETRAACADALPAVVSGAGPRRYGAALHDVTVRLVADAEPQVRLAVARRFADLAALLGRDRASQYLRQLLGALLRDEERQVASAAVARLPEVLPLFATPQAKPAPPQSVFGGGGGRAAPTAAGTPAHTGCAEFVEPLLRLEALSGHDWRLQLGLLRCVGEGGGALFPPDALADRWAPLALRHLAEGPAVLQQAAAGAVAEAWHAARRPAQRTAIYARLLRELALSHTARRRTAFVALAAAALARFSCAFFRRHLLEACLLLAADRVAAVRAALCEAMPAMKQVCGHRVKGGAARCHQDSPC